MKYYLFDIEMLFSKDPSLSKSLKNLSFINPNKETLVDLTSQKLGEKISVSKDGYSTLKMEIPQELAHKPLYV